MPLSEDVVEWMHRCAFMSLATRDEKLRPLVTTVMGAVAEAGADTATFFLPAPMAEPALSHLKQNGKVAFNFGDGASHRCFQLKGSYLSSRPASPQEVGIAEICLNKLVSFLGQSGFSAEIQENIGKMKPYLDPSVAVTFKVEEMYDQTPGPLAGKAIS